MHETVKRSVFKKQRRRPRICPLSLRVPDDYSPVELQRDRANAGQILDLSGGEYRLADVLAALEWQCTVFDWFRDEGFGDKVIVDVSRSNPGEWTSSSDMSVARGLLALNRVTPTWILQRSGQNAHLWPGFREQPIFTRHLDEQFRWLHAVFLNPIWSLYYLANSTLSLEPNLQAAMIAAVAHSAGPEAVKFTRQSEGVGVLVPEPRSFFGESKQYISRLRPNRQAGIIRVRYPQEDHGSSGGLKPAARHVEKDAEPSSKRLL